MLPKQIYGEFFGADLGPKDCDVITIQHIPLKLRNQEPALYRSKWFDYRRLHPLMATYLLVHCYGKAYGEMIRVIEDNDKGKFTRGMKAHDFLDSREKLAFWKLRQKIDELGIRYDFFLREAMTWCIENGRQQPPRPCHIPGNDDMVVQILNAWEIECRSRLQFPKDEYFSVSNFVGNADQLAYEAWLIERIKQRRHPKYSLHAALYINDVLRIEAALENFDAHTVESAIDECLAE